MTDLLVRLINVLQLWFEPGPSVNLYRPTLCETCPSSLESTSTGLCINLYRPSKTSVTQRYKYEEARAEVFSGAFGIGSAWSMVSMVFQIGHGGGEIGKGIYMTVLMEIYYAVDRRGYKNRKERHVR